MEPEQYFYEAFSNMERLGPGSTESTKRAIQLYSDPEACFKILDIGCGTGAHTFLLAEQFPKAQITAIDTHAPYISRLNKSAKEKGISGRVQGFTMSMFALAFKDESFDLIWAEGAVYIIGFKRGLTEWKRFLKPGGYLICSEISWLKQNPSAESFLFWKQGYPEIDTIVNKLKNIETAGYALKGCFVCPVSDWTANYYNPMQKNLDRMRKKYVQNGTALQTVSLLQAEIDLYKRHSNDYSYVFYAMKKENEMLIRQETPNDYEEIYSVVKNAFKTAEHSDGNEQDLVTALRSSEAFVPELSLVALIEGKIAGHIMFTEAKVGNETVLVLAPLSVSPDYQKQGVGTALIQEAHKIAKELGYAYSLVLGSEKYYPRSGYIPAAQFGIEVPEGIPSANFMAIQLQENASPVRGAVKYAKEFGI